MKYVKILTDEGIDGLGEATPSALVLGEMLDGIAKRYARGTEL